jgi:hypothetical protein
LFAQSLLQHFRISGSGSIVMSRVPPISLYNSCNRTAMDSDHPGTPPDSTVTQTRPGAGLGPYRQSPSSDWQLGQRIAFRWDVRNVLRGGMGVVYIVYDHFWHEAYAAKTFLDSVFALNPEIETRFVTEVRTWIDLEKHDNVVQAKFVEIIGGKPYVFVEYVEGGSLSSWIGTSRLRKDLPQILRFAIQFCDGMNHIVAKGIQAHRDIKPQNCLVTQDGVLKITDFGLAKIFHDVAVESSENDVSNVGGDLRLSRTGIALGTCTHMAPEQFLDSKHVDIRTDVYSFGVMLFQMLTEGLPFTGKTWSEFAAAHINAPPAGRRIGECSSRPGGTQVPCKGAGWAVSGLSCAPSRTRGGLWADCGKVCYRGVRSSRALEKRVGLER